MIKNQLEKRPGEIVMTTAKKLHHLDSFFALFSSNSEIQEFLDQNRHAVYTELAYRLFNNQKKELFGSFEPLLDRAQHYLKNNSDSEKKIGRIKKIQQTPINAKILLKVTRQHGIHWIPKEFQQKVAFSMLILPTTFVIYESMRATIVASLLKSNIKEFTYFIFGLYVLVATMAVIQEQKTLKYENALIFNGYGNLFSLGLSAGITSVLTRTPKYLTEFSLAAGALASQKELDSALLTPVLSSFVAATIWSLTDFIFNYSQEKIQNRKNGKLEYNLN
jgi:hypothetical protein